MTVIRLSLVLALATTCTLLSMAGPNTSSSSEVFESLCMRGRTRLPSLYGESEAMGFGDFVFGVAGLLFDQRPSQVRRRKAQKDTYKREQALNPFIKTDVGTCFACEGKGHKDWACRSCEGTGRYEYAAKPCNPCNGTGRYTFAAKRCNQCIATGDQGAIGCAKCNALRAGKPPKIMDCRKCSGTGIYALASVAACKKCDGSRKYRPPCKKCSGSGTIRFR
jgi:hypothetical protein